MELFYFQCLSSHALLIRIFTEKNSIKCLNVKINEYWHKVFGVLILVTVAFDSNGLRNPMNPMVGYAKLS